MVKSRKKILIFFTKNENLTVKFENKVKIMKQKIYQSNVSPKHKEFVDLNE